MIHVITARYAGDLSLFLQFDDDTSGTADLSELVTQSEVFAALRQQAVFSQAFVEDGTVCWPGDLDVSAERLYALVHGLPAPTTLEQAKTNESTVRAREQARRVGEGGRS